MDDHRDGAHKLAAWARKPFVCTASVTLFGAGCIALSLVAPLGIAFLALAIVGATAVVAGLVTMLVLTLGSLLGLRRRSDAIATDWAAEPAPSAAEATSTLGPASPVDSVDLRSSERQSTAA